MAKISSKTCTNRRTGRTGFYKKRESDFFFCAFKNFIIFFPVCKFAAADTKSWNKRDSCIIKNCLCFFLVHCNCRSQRRTADIRNSNHFKKSLDCSVFSKSSVQDRENNVCAQNFSIYKKSPLSSTTRNCHYFVLFCFDNFKMGICVIKDSF